MQQTNRSRHRHMTSFQVISLGFLSVILLGSLLLTVVEVHIVSLLEGVILSVVADLVGVCDSRLRIMASVRVHVHQSVVDLA